MNSILKFETVLIFVVCISEPVFGQATDPSDSSKVLNLTTFSTFSSIASSGAIDLQHSYDGTGRVFVSTNEGKIHAFSSTGSSLGTFLDLDAPGVLPDFDNSLNFTTRGLSYMTFHPDYGNVGAAGEGKLYTWYKTTEPSASDHDYSAVGLTSLPGSIISEYSLTEWTVDAGNTNQIDTSSAREVFRVEISGPNENTHSIGQPAFNPFAEPGDADYGNLYFGIGDMNNQASVNNYQYVQDNDNPFGKILRINPLQNGSDAYSIPTDNPFYDGGNLLDNDSNAEEIYAWGFRNPQNLSFAEDSQGDSRMVVFDIGAADYEEVNIVDLGDNHGWTRYDGPVDGNLSTTLNLPAGSNLEFPATVYDHEFPITPGATPMVGNAAITGGFVVSDPNDASFQNQLLFGDLSTGAFFHSDFDELVTADNSNTQAAMSVMNVSIDGSLPGGFADQIGQTRGDVRFGTDEGGRVFLFSKRDGEDIIYLTDFVAARSASPPGIVSPSSASNMTANYLQNWTNATISNGTYVLPSSLAGDTMVIDQGKTIEVDTSISVNPGELFVANTNSGLNNSSLNVNSGGSLNLQGTLTIAQLSDEGTVNVQGGNLSTNSAVTVLTGGKFNLSSGSFTNTGTGPRTIFTDTNGLGGELNISGGTFTAYGAAPTDILRLENDVINISGGTVDMTGGQVLLADTTTLNILGSEADITMDRFNLSLDSRAATVNFVFDADGVSTIKNNSFLNLSNGTLNIDGSNYTGGEATFDLFTSTNVASLAPEVNITGFGTEGINYTFEQSTSSNIVQLTILETLVPQQFTRIDLDESNNSLFNGSFEEITVDIGTAGNNAKVTGSNTSLDVHEANQYTINDWETFYSDPNDVLSRYGNSGSISTDAWYLTTLSSINPGAGDYEGERGILIDSAEGYEQGLVNQDFLSNLDPKFLNPNAEYRLSVNLIRRTNNLAGDADGTATVMITDSDIDPTNEANSIIGGLLSQDISTLDIGNNTVELILSGSDLMSAIQLNLVIKQVNSSMIGIEDVPGQDTDFVSQIVFDDFILTAYLPGDSDGDFDVDQDDYDAWAAGYGTVGTGDFFNGDFNGDGNVDAADYTVWRDNFTGSLSSAIASSVPEPSSLLLLTLALLACKTSSRSSI